MPGCPARMLGRLKELLKAADDLHQRLNEATPDRYQVPNDLPFFESCAWAKQDRPFIHQTWVDASCGLTELTAALADLVDVYEAKAGKPNGVAGREAKQERAAALANSDVSIANEVDSREVSPVGSLDG